MMNHALPRVISFNGSIAIGRHVGELATHEEVLCPIALIIRITNHEETIRFANDTQYGLSSAVFTRSRT